MSNLRAGSTAGGDLLVTRNSLYDSNGRIPSSVGGVPTGSLTMWAAATPPDGWLICDGTAKSRTTYAQLFLVLGTAYGAGDGSTTFNLPDTRSRSPIGAGTGPLLTNRNLASTGGTETHTLTTTEMPSHNHTLGGTGGTGSYAGRYGVYSGIDTPVTSSTGGGGAHNNMHPWIAFNFIIKY